MIIQRHHLPRHEQNKKALPICQKSSKYFKPIFLSRSLTYLSRFSSGWSWHLTFSCEASDANRCEQRKLKQVVKASTGHFPQPFLIRDVVRTAAKITLLPSYYQISGPLFNTFKYNR